MKPALGIGTAQWGMHYGIRNVKGQTPLHQIERIVVEAKKNSVSLIDTAPIYGSAEAYVGEKIDKTFKIVTKTSQIEQINEIDPKRLRTDFFQSLKQLKRSAIYGVLVHRVEDLFTLKQQIIINHLKNLKEEGLVEKIGISIYTKDQIDTVLKFFKPDIIQLPLNVLDQRLVNSGTIKELYEIGVEVHARSIFLQGLLLYDEKDLPKKFHAISPSIRKWNDAAKRQGLTLTEACLLHVRQITGVHSIIVGTDTVSQFNECLNIFKSNCSFDSAGLSVNDEAFLNPSYWKHL